MFSDFATRLNEKYPCFNFSDGSPHEHCRNLLAPLYESNPYDRDVCRSVPSL